MNHDFDHIAKRLWFLDPDVVRLVASLPEKDRRSIEQALLSLYGATVQLTGKERDIKKTMEKVRR
jgi:hypothetical protein